MSIKLFQNDRNWEQIKNEVWNLVQEDHSKGIAQKGVLNERLESYLAATYNRQHCVTTATCSDALTIALFALKLPPKSRIAVANYTFSATATSVLRAGHIVVPIDVNDDYCINTTLIPHDVAAVVVVDIFGNMSDWKRLNDLGIPVICDAAQSLESKASGAWSAAQGYISCVSFSPSKTISSWGSGGALLTDDAEVAAFARKLRLHGKETNAQHSIHPGMNSMMSSFEAAAVLTGFAYADKWQERRLNIARFLISQSQYSTAINLDQTRHTLHKLVFQSKDRDAVISKFKQAGVDCVVHYDPLVSDEEIFGSTAQCRNSDRLKSISFTVPNQHTLTDPEVEVIGKLLS